MNSKNLAKKIACAAAMFGAASLTAFCNLTRLPQTQTILVNEIRSGLRYMID
jgi:hypothetical protein